MYPVIYDSGLTIPFIDIPLVIGGYGLMMFIGIVVGWLFVRQLGRQVYPDAPWADIYFGAILAGLIGCRLLNLVIFLPQLIAGETTVRAVLWGGGVWLGGVILGFVFVWIVVRWNRLELGKVTDLFFAVIPLCHAIGRIGCLLGGCCYGKACSLPWAITYTDPRAFWQLGTPLHRPLHPVPIYEAIVELINFGITFGLWRRRVPPWTITAVWTGLYGMERFVLENFRNDPRGGIALLSTSQLISIGMVVAAIVTLILVRRRGLAADSAQSIESAGESVQSDLPVADKPLDSSQ